jgi:hypothetical protein
MPSREPMPGKVPPATRRTKDELELLVNTLSELMVLSETNQMQRTHTRQALDMLRTVLEQES